MKTSIIIPARAETVENLSRTIQSIKDNVVGEYDITIGYDGPPYYDFDGVQSIKFPGVVGLRNNINALASMATGKYIFKVDAHCSFGKGFDEILKADMQDNWVVVPRFYVLNGETWQWQDERFYDYFYLSCPFTDPKGFRFKAGGHWPERTAERLDIPIDETPSLHGSSWFVDRDHFFNKIGGFPVFDPHGHGQDSVYLALKQWLGPWDGKLMVNKKTWVAHLHQDGNKRGFHMDRRQTERTYNLFANYWMGNKWEERAHDMEYFIEKFMPMPTWPENWRELYQQWITK